jgi:hypothetical protein
LSAATPRKTPDISIREAALIHFAAGLASHLGVPINDHVLESVCVAIYNAAEPLYEAAKLRHATVLIPFVNGWPGNAEIRQTFKLDTENRKPADWDK